MFNIGAGEMVFILVAALLVLGPQRLPELARAIGKFVREFRRQTDEVRNVVEREFYSMDQEFQREPTPRPGTRFGAPPDTIAPLTSSNEVVPHANPGVHDAPPAAPDASNALGLEPARPNALGLETARPDALGLEPARLPEPAAVDGVPASSPEAPPSLVSPATPAPIPGTVARNAPKRS